MSRDTTESPGDQASQSVLSDINVDETQADPDPMCQCDRDTPMASGAQLVLYYLDDQGDWSNL